MDVKATLRPATNGTKALLRQYGDRLVCVRYRYDKKKHKRYSTAEIIIDEKDWHPGVISRPDKVVLLRAIAEVGRNTNGRCWITEVNWPLWEGPHSPAGKAASVDEEAQACYLTRYFLLALGTGLVERVYWWRLVARGYGLVSPDRDRVLRRRPGYEAFTTLIAELEGATEHRQAEELGDLHPCAECEDQCAFGVPASQQGNPRLQENQQEISCHGQQDIDHVAVDEHRKRAFITRAGNEMQQRHRYPDAEDYQVFAATLPPVFWLTRFHG